MGDRTESRQPLTTRHRKRALAALGVVTVAVVWLGRPPATTDQRDHPSATERTSSESTAPLEPAEPATSHRSELSPAPPPPMDLWAQSSLAGRLVSTDGEPVSDAQVHLMTRSEWLHLTPEMGARPRERSLRTAADGRFAFSGVPTKARVSLRVKAPGFAEHDSSWYGTVPAPELMDVGDLILDEECVLRGQVRDERGEPIAGALIRDHGNVLPPGPHVTDAAGRFEIRGVEAYRYDLIASARGFAPPLPPYPERKLRLGEAWEGIQFVLSRGVPVDGRVIDEAGQPLAGAEITLAHEYGALTAGGFIGGGTYALGHPTDAEGRFSVIAVSGAEGVVSVQAEGYARASKPLALLLPGESATSVEVGDIVVSRLRRIRFRVVDKNGAVTPARPPWIRLHFAPSNAGMASGVTPARDASPPRPRSPRSPMAGNGAPAAAGHEEHHSAIRNTWREEPDGFSVLSQYDGTFSVRVPSVSGDFTCGPFVTSDDTDVEASLIYLPSAATAIGAVVDRQGRGVAARVRWVVKETMHVLASAITSATGRFELVGAELATPVSTLLVVEPLRHARRDIEIAGLRAGETNELRPVVVDDGAEVETEVLGLRGELASGAHVALWREGAPVGEERDFEIVQSDHAGRATLVGLSAGLWRIRVISKSLWIDRPPTAAPRWTGTPETGDAVVSLAGEARTFVRLDARTAGLSQLVGRVTIDGEPARGHEVNFTRRYDPGQWPPKCRVRADGTYQSPLFLPQELRVGVLRRGLDEELGAEWVTLLPGSISRLDLDLQPARLSVSVVDDVGALVPSEVDIAFDLGTSDWSEDGEEMPEFRRSGNLLRGHGAGEHAPLLFEDLPPGRWRVVICRLNAAIDEAQTVYLTLAPGEDRELALRRTYPGAWRVRLEVSGDRPWEDRLRDAEEAGGFMELRATRHDGLRHRFEMSVDDHGVVEEEQIEPGRWDLQLVLVGNGAPRVLGATSVEVFSGQTAEAVLPARE